MQDFAFGLMKLEFTIILSGTFLLLFSLTWS
jgi:hypothetical protein